MELLISKRYHGNYSIAELPVGRCLKTWPGSKPFKERKKKIIIIILFSVFYGGIAPGIAIFNRNSGKRSIIMVYSLVFTSQSVNSLHLLEKYK